MGIFKRRTQFINEAINRAPDQEIKRLLSVGFIPESMRPEYEQFMQGPNDEQDTDLDKISNENYFAIQPGKVAGNLVAGTGFLNPVLVKGSIADVLNVINNTMHADNSKPKTFILDKEEIFATLKEMAAKSRNVEQFINGVQHIAGNFDLDTSAPEFIAALGLETGNPEKNIQILKSFYRQHAGAERKKREAARQYSTAQHNVANIEQLAYEQIQKEEQMAKKDFTPKVEVKQSDLAIIKAHNLLQDEIKEKTQTTAQTIKKYSPSITDDEIKAWVYHKRKFGNPMKGWEKYFLAGGAGSNILLRTNKETMVKDNRFADLRVIPANTILGAKTKFKHEYKEVHYFICKTVTGELVWVNVADVKEIKNVTSESQGEIDKLVQAKALIFDGSEYYPYPVYLFGNIYDRIKTLSANKEEIITKYGEAFYEEQMALVKTYLPKLKSFRDPVRNNRPHILCLSEFANKWEQFGVKELHEESGVKLGSTKRGRFQEQEDKISLFEAFKQWMDEFVKDTDLKGTTRANIKKYYFAKSVSWEKDPMGNDILTNTQKEELIGAAREAAEDLFSDFLASALTFEDAVALDAIWNEKYNAFTNVIQFVDKVPVGFDGSSMFKNGELGIKPAQRQGLAYLQLTGSGCLAYDVGFGKTLTGILNIAQLMSQGAIRRPLVIVPKPTYKNWLKELFGYWTDGEKVEFKEFAGAQYHYGVFSGMKVNVNDWYNLSGKHYQKLLIDHGGDINKLVPENTITIVSYKGFEQMGFSRDISDEMFNSIARVLMQKDVAEEPTDKKGAKEQVSFYQKMQGWLGIGNKNAIVNVDTCGFDHITVDEAHNFKNVFPSCGKDPATGRKLFGISAGQSSRAVKMFFITNYIQAKYGKKVTLLTATPFTNSPLEIYSELSFVGLETLNQYNLFNIKKFFEQFVLETIEYAIDSKGEIITKPVIKSFQNLKLLQTILFNHFHHKDDPKEAGVVRPCRIDLPSKDITTYLDMNEWQRRNQVIVKEVAKSVSRTNPGAGLRAMAMSLDNAFSPFLFDKTTQPESAADFVEQSPKIKYATECIKSVKQWHESRGEDPSGIILYSNRGVAYFDLIKDYLINELGYKSKITYDEEVISEVEIISGGGGEAEEDRKELIKDAFNAGVVKVIIGTGTIREGINLQSRSALTIDLYPEWNPTDITQLKGRNWRQGNMFGYVRFVMPLVINSMDNFVNQKLDEKSKRIANLWKPIGDMNRLQNTADLDPAEIKYALVDDANEKFKMKFDTIKNELNREFSVLEENHEMLATISSNIEDLKQAEERLYEDLMEKKPQITAYRDLLKKQNPKVWKDDDKKKTANDIERVLNNVNELLEAIGKYEASRFDINLLLAALRLIKQRDYNVFTDHSAAGLALAKQISDAVEYYTFNVYGSAYDAMVSAWSTVRKAEKSVLNAYGKSWQDDIADIKKDVLKRIDKLKLQAEHVQSEKYKETMLAEIEAEMEAQKSARGNLDEQVLKFASLNHTLSYLTDNTDKENCPIPTDPCCASTGATTMHADKEHGEPVVSTVISKKTQQAAVSAEELEIREAIELLSELLPDVKGAEKKEIKEAIELLSEMLPAQMAQGGPIISNDEAQQIWDNWSLGQRICWLENHELDHFNMAFEWDELDHPIRDNFMSCEVVKSMMAKGGPVDPFKNATYYIDFLNKKKGFQKDRKTFPSHEAARKWGIKNLENFNSDMIHIKLADELATGGPVNLSEAQRELTAKAKALTEKHGGEFQSMNFKPDGVEINVSFKEKFTKDSLYPKEIAALIREYDTEMRKGGPVISPEYQVKLNRLAYYMSPLSLDDEEIRMVLAHEGLTPEEIAEFMQDRIKYGTEGKDENWALDRVKAILGVSTEQEEEEEEYDPDNDLFRDYSKLPKNVVKVLKKYEKEEESYELNEEILKKLKPLGYTFDYYLDAVPYNLRKIDAGKKSKPNPKMRTGGPIDQEINIMFITEEVQGGAGIDEALLQQILPHINDIGLLLEIHEGKASVAFGEEVINGIPENMIMDLPAEMRRGGPAGRTMAALKKDRKYYNPAQAHEVRYAKQHKRRKKRYQKQS